MRAVLDTNVLVSALWSPQGKASAIVTAALRGHITPCMDGRILAEYQQVLLRPRFRFSPALVNDLLWGLTSQGLLVEPAPLSLPQLPDPSDLPFLETACHCQALLVTGNLKHYPPAHPLVMTVATLYEQLPQGDA